MNNVALHMRITSALVTDEDVDRRNLAVTDLATSYGEMKVVSDILSLAEDIGSALGGDGSPSEWLGEDVQDFVQKHSSSFIYSERPLEVGICSGMAAYSVISATPTSMTAFTAADILAVSLWSVLGFQCQLAEQPKREALRVQILNAAQDRVTAAAEYARKRSDVADFAPFNITAEELDKVPASFKKASSATVEALRRNAAIDREELDFLWWVLLDRSRLLKKPFSAIEEPGRVVAAGIEAAMNLRRMPCDVHHELVLRTVSTDVGLDLEELLAAIGADRSVLISRFDSARLENASLVFPTLLALHTGRVDVPGATVKRTTSEWGSRTLLEASIYHVCYNDPGKL
jgi:hypothetical protein